jgi:hypothetical protein
MYGNFALSRAAQVACSSWQRTDLVRVSDGEPVSILDSTGRVVASTQLGPEEPTQLSKQAMEETGIEMVIHCERHFTVDVPKSDSMVFVYAVSSGQAFLLTAQ